MSQQGITFATSRRTAERPGKDATEKLGLIGFGEFWLVLIALHFVWFGIVVWILAGGMTWLNLSLAGVSIASVLAWCGIASHWWRA